MRPIDDWLYLFHEYSFQSYLTQFRLSTVLPAIPCGTVGFLSQRLRPLLMIASPGKAWQSGLIQLIPLAQQLRCTPLSNKVHIECPILFRHSDSFCVQEALEQKIVLDGVCIGNTDEVTHQGTNC